MKNMYTVKETLDILGIVRTTLYLWELKGHINPVRHPVNKYRFYKKEEVDALASNLSRFDKDNPKASEVDESN